MEGPATVGNQQPPSPLGKAPSAQLHLPTPASKQREREARRVPAKQARRRWPGQDHLAKIKQLNAPSVEGYAVSPKYSGNISMKCTGAPGSSASTALKGSQLHPTRRSTSIISATRTSPQQRPGAEPKTRAPNQKKGRDLIRGRAPIARTGNTPSPGSTTGPRNREGKRLGQDQEAGRRSSKITAPPQQPQPKTPVGREMKG